MPHVLLETGPIDHVFTFVRYKTIHQTLERHVIKKTDEVHGSDGDGKIDGSFPDVLRDGLHHDQILYVQEVVIIPTRTFYAPRRRLAFGSEI